MKTFFEKKSLEPRLSNYKDYYYKYKKEFLRNSFARKAEERSSNKALKYYLKNNSIERQIKGGERGENFQLKAAQLNEEKQNLEKSIAEIVENKNTVQIKLNSLLKLSENEKIAANNLLELSGNSHLESQKNEDVAKLFFDEECKLKDKLKELEDQLNEQSKQLENIENELKKIIPRQLQSHTTDTPNTYWSRMSDRSRRL